MQSFQFWRAWDRPYRRLGFLVGALLLLAILFSWVAYIQYPALPWDRIQELEVEKISIHPFVKGPFSLEVWGQNHIIFEYVLGGPIAPHAVVGYGFLVVLFFFVALGLSIVSVLPRFWHYIGLSLFLFFFVSLRLELLRVLGRDDQWVVAVALFAYLLPSFYFRFYSNATPFHLRLIVFLAITAILGALTARYATVQMPLLFLAANSIPAAALISVTLICMAAHEIMAFFLYATSRAALQGKSMRHFLLISLIYLANLTVAYLHSLGLLSADWVYFNPMLLLTLSAALGIWGFRHRKPQYSSILPADPFGVYLIVGLSMVCFATLGYLLSSANDAPFDTLERMIIYSHLGYGVIFVVYVLSNFAPLMAKDTPVYHFLYRPSRVSYFIFRFAGLVATLCFVFYSSWQIAANSIFAGMYNAKADIYRSVGEHKLADTFYRYANIYGSSNHHANYAMGYEKSLSYDALEAEEFYTQAVSQRPTIFAYINLSQLVQNTQGSRQALELLHRAASVFPDNGPIQNAVGIRYARMSWIDSAAYFFGEAAQHAPTQEMASGNLLALWAKNHLPLDVDSLLEASPSGHTALMQSNGLALLNHTRQQTSIRPDLSRIEKEGLNLFSSSLINNYVVHRILEAQHDRPFTQVDSAFVDALVALPRDSLRRPFDDACRFAAALAYYEMGRVWDAFKLLEGLASASSQGGWHNAVLASWSLEQGSPQNALLYLDYALRHDYAGSPMFRPVTLLESGRLAEALTAWHQLQDDYPAYRAEAQAVILALETPPSQLAKLTDGELRIYSRYRLSLGDTPELHRTLEQTMDGNAKAEILLEQSQRLLEQDEVEAAAAMLKKIDGLPITDKALYAEIADFELLLLAERGDTPTLSLHMKRAATPASGEARGRGAYYRALLAERAGDTLGLALRYERIARRNPYFEEGVVAAADYLRRTASDPLKSYTLLADALQYNAYSVKLLKAYSLAAARMGFYPYAQSALQRLQELMGDEAMRRFLHEEQDVFSAVLAED